MTPTYIEVMTILNTMLLHGHFCCDPFLLIGWNGIFWLLIIYNLSIKVGICYNLRCVCERNKTCKIVFCWIVFLDDI